MNPQRETSLPIPMKNVLSLDVFDEQSTEVLKERLCGKIHGFLET